MLEKKSGFNVESPVSASSCASGAASAPPVPLAGFGLPSRVCLIGSSLLLAPSRRGALLAARLHVGLQGLLGFRRDAPLAHRLRRHPLGALGVRFSRAAPCLSGVGPFSDDGDGAVRPPNKLCAVLADELVKLRGARLFAEDDSGCADGFAVVDLVDADPQMAVEEQCELR